MKRWSEYEINFMKEHYGVDLYAKDIAEILGRTHDSVFSKARQVGLSAPYGGRWSKIKVNYDVFERIDTPEKAYWFGFLKADAYISENGFALELKKEDKYVLQKFAGFIGLNKEPVERKGRNSAYLCIYQKQIYDAFKKAKLKDNNIPVFEDDGLFKYFLRGLIDGDGCVYIDKRSENIGWCLYGDKKLLSEVKNKLESLGFDLGKINDARGEQNCRIGMVGNKKALSFLKWLYDGREDLALKRKKNIVKKFIGD